MSDRKKAFWFIALLSVLVVVPFLGETIFYSKGGTAGGDCCPFYAGKWKLDTSGELWY